MSRPLHVLLARHAGPPTSGRRRRVGFTLVEIVSVVAIIGVLTGMSIPRLNEAIEKARVAKAIGDIRAIAVDLRSQDSLPASLAIINRATLLDPWGRPYIYYKYPVTKGKGVPGARKDRFLVPINSEFDVYSLGKDGASSLPLTAKASHDDVIYASDGGFIGLARNF